MIGNSKLKIKNLSELNNENQDIITKNSASIINAGGVILMPFDTVYGFVCDPKNDKTIERIFELKNRPTSKTIGTAVCCIEELEKYTKINHFDFIKQRVPGPYTFILNRRLTTDNRPLSFYCYQNNTLGVRIPDNHLVLNIANAAGGIIAQTSANKSGLQNCTNINDILDQFTDKELNTIDLIIDGGNLGNQKPSELWDLTKTSPVKIERS